MKRPLTFVDGIGVGIGALILLPLCYFAVRHGDYDAMYRDLQASRLPALTRLVLHPAFAYGAPLVLGGGLGLALWQRPNRWLIFAIGAAALVVTILAFYGAYLPIGQLAGNIRAD